MKTTPYTLYTSRKIYKCLYVLMCFGFVTLSSCKKDFEVIKFNSADNYSEAVSAKPNILFIVGDDVGYEVPTCDGGQSYSTPNLDKLALNGMLYTQCHSSPMCVPSRVSLLTGKYNFRNYTTWGYLKTDQRTIANMLSNAGYATCYAGKWQLDGGYNSIKTFGWQRYSVWLPFKLSDEQLEGSRYKSAKIYQSGKYMPDSFSLNKYSDDLFTSYLLHFIDSVHNLNKPFFAYYSMILCHMPISPTPDNPEYATWDFAHFQSAPKFFSSNVKYMDKKIGQILTHLYQKSLLQNTVIVYVGDNGTESCITSRFNNFSVTGGKKQTNEPGTNVPLIISFTKFSRNKKCNSLISFTDFLPTLADITGTPKPVNYGTLDGVSFYPTLVNGDTSQLRENIFNSYCLEPSKNPWVRWVQDDQYKLYDTNRTTSSYNFVKIAKCRPDSALTTLTAEQKAIEENFKAVLRSYDPH